MRTQSHPPLAVLHPGDRFPPLTQAWPPGSDAPGLLAVGGTLDVPTLLQAYSSTIYPWFSEGEPVLWWSPDPRMVLDVASFRLHRSLRKTLKRFRENEECEIRVDTAFSRVIEACAHVPRAGQSGTWIGPDIIHAYQDLHAAGHAHSVETWIGGRLVAGLYCVAIGRAVFGESMFTEIDDGSKIALAALVAFCRQHDIPLVDCQQVTKHLASLGAAPIPRAHFAELVRLNLPKPAPTWQFQPVYWNTLLSPPQPPGDAP